MKPLITILALLCASCAGPHAFLEVQRVAPASQLVKGREENKWGVGLNLLFPITDRLSFQLQPVAGFNGNGALRTALVWQLF